MSLNPRITDWHGQHVWLVGASSGIGRATASRLHALGAQVTVSARSAPALASFVADHPGAQALALDATDADAVAAAAQTLQQRHGQINLVMYCAGHYNPMHHQVDLAMALLQGLGCGCHGVGVGSIQRQAQRARVIGDK